MKLDLIIPSTEQVLTGGLSVPVARRGQRWSETCLGRYAKEQGVYVIHHAERVKYVGKTDGPTMSFGMRLRREFQENASEGRHIFPKLAGLRVPPDIKVFFFVSEEIRDLVVPTGLTLADTQRIAVLETALIQVWKPDFQSDQGLNEAV